MKEKKIRKKAEGSKVKESKNLEARFGESRQSLINMNFKRAYD
jgi:hypothetical protein